MEHKGGFQQNQNGVFIKNRYYLVCLSKMHFLHLQLNCSAGGGLSVNNHPGFSGKFAFAVVTLHSFYTLAFTPDTCSCLL